MTDACHHGTDQAQHPVSVPQMTSLFMHASPAMVIWALRWHPSHHIQDLAALDPAAAKAFNTGGVKDIVSNAMVLYMIWAVAYYLKARTFCPPQLKGS